ncbi:MAG TPA: FAD-dependent oxidoreductase [Streptosporangiaceae bacterium]
MQQRVVVVGGGVLGLMHAVQARQRGCQVVHLEREAGSRGATVRNFGLVWVSGRAAGPELDLALRARQLWEELGARVPAAGFRAHGSLTLAVTEAEAGLLAEAAGRPDSARREFRLLGPAQVRALNPAIGGDVRAGLYCARDAIVEPRLVPGAIRDYLLAGGQDGGYTWLPGREAVAVADGAVRDHAGHWHHGDLVVLCTGAAHTGVAGPHLAGFAEPPVRRVRLQMLQTEPFAGRLTTSVADGDTLRYYPAYDLPGRARLGPQPPAAAATAAQLLMTQRLDGSLTIGDTHAYDEPFPFDVDELAYEHLKHRAELLLGVALPPVRRRWAGVYSQATGTEVYHRSRVAAGVELVTGPGGRGMTLAPAIAEQTFNGQTAAGRTLTGQAPAGPAGPPDRKDPP